MATEDIIAQHHYRWGAGQKLLCQNKGLRQTVRAGLHFILERDAPLATIAQDALKLICIIGSGDNHDLTDTSHHQHGQGVIDHRLVVDRQQLFRHAHSNGIKPCAGAASKNNTLSLCHSQRSRIISVKFAILLCLSWAPSRGATHTDNVTPNLCKPRFGQVADN